MSDNVLEITALCWTNGLGQADPNRACRFGMSCSCTAGSTTGIAGGNAAGTVASISLALTGAGDGWLVKPSVNRMW